MRSGVSILLCLLFGAGVAAFAQTGPANAFSIARIKWGGGSGWFFNPQWSHDYPVAEYNLMFQLRQITAIPITQDVPVVELSDPELFNHPFAYMCEVQDCTLSDEEAEGLREYLLRGGFILIDDAWTEEGFAHFSGELKKAFPNRSIERITTDHPIFHTFYAITEIPVIQPGRRWRAYRSPTCYGLSDDSGRLMMLINWDNDVGDGWEWAATDPHTGVSAYKLGINYILYAMSH
jgi:hypothetical protein